MDAEMLLAVAANAAVVVLAIAAWLAWRSYTTAEQRKAVRTAVLAAEQKLGSGPERRDWVLNNLERIFPKLSPELLEILVEAAVYEMNLEKEAIEMPSERLPKPSKVGQQL